MANLTEYLTIKYTKVITEMVGDLGKMADEAENLKSIIRALKNPDIMMNGISLTLDMVQVMENGDVRIIPPPPAPGPDTCSPDKNGKKTEKELVNAS